MRASDRVLYRSLCLLLLLLCGPATAQVRGLVKWHETRAVQCTVVTANNGWHTLYSQKFEARAGDVLQITAQAQLTLDSQSLIGQQMRLTVNGRQVGTQPIEFNDQPGSHHLPMTTTALVVVGRDETVEVKAQASAFHTEGNFPVVVDYAENMDYGALTTQQFRDFPDLTSARESGALFLSEFWVSAPPTQDRVGVTPYQQEAIGEIRLTQLEPGELLWLSGQTVGVARWGLEMLAGVITYQEKAASPYGGQNVAEQNLFAPLQLQGVRQIREALELARLEWRVYGGFTHGLALYPGATRFEALRFSPMGQLLHSYGQRGISSSRLPSNAGFQELVSRDLELEAGDVVRLYGLAQFGRPEHPQPVTLECRARVQVTGPVNGVATFSQKNITPTKGAVPVSSFLTFRADEPGTYRISLAASGYTDIGAVPMVLDAQHSQLQYLHFR